MFYLLGHTIIQIQVQWLLSSNQKAQGPQHNQRQNKESMLQGSLASLLYSSLTVLTIQDRISVHNGLIIKKTTGFIASPAFILAGMKAT